MTNPSVESSLSPWANNGSLATVTRETTVGAYAGTASVQVVRATNTLGVGANHGAAFPIANGLPVTPSSSYTSSVWVRKISGTDPNLFISNIWYTSGGAYIGEQGGTVTAVTSTTSWVRLSVTSTAPVNAATVRPIVRENIAIGKAASTWQFDAYMTEQGSSLRPYFDGSTADAYSGYELQSGPTWTGTAHASTSTGTWGLVSSGTNGDQLDDETVGLG